jgi:hypothetical protein
MYLFYTRVYRPGEKFNDIDFLLIQEEITQEEITQEELKQFFEGYKQKQNEKYKYLKKDNEYFGDPINCWFKSINATKDVYLQNYLKQ